MGQNHCHKVCTYREAEKAVKAHQDIYLNNCFCRQPKKEGKSKVKYCGHEIETCMGFNEPKPTDEFQYEYRKITQEHALSIIQNWKEEGNLFRFMEDEEWICCCCKCGCGWFFDEAGNRTEDKCDKSSFIEKTDLNICNLCGKCISVCAYDARIIQNEKMIINAEKCYGCSACEYICPVDAIEMVKRS